MFPKLVLKTLILAVLCIGLYSLCAAQEAGSRDVTENWRAPQDHLLIPPVEICPEIKSTIDAPKKEAPQNDGPQNGKPETDAPQSAIPKARSGDPVLALTISDLTPRQLHPGEDFTATVRLKNVSTAGIRIPWQPDGEQVTRESSDGSEEKYEVADVNFRIVSGSQGRLPVYLESYGALFAHPQNRDNYKEIQPGHWVNVRFKGTVACGLPECSVEIRPDEHATLTAIWYQRVLVHSIRACNEKHSSLLVRQLDSTPFPVVIQRKEASTGDPAQKKESRQP